MLLKMLKGTRLISVLIIFLTCHSVTVNLKKEKEINESSQEIKIRHYSTLFGWKEISDIHSANCSDQNGEVNIREDFLDALNYFFLAPALVSESISVRCEAAE